MMHASIYKYFIFCLSYNFNNSFLLVHVFFVNVVYLHDCTMIVLPLGYCKITENRPHAPSRQTRPPPRGGGGGVTCVKDVALDSVYDRN